MIDFETQKLKYWTLKVNDTNAKVIDTMLKEQWYNALKAMFQVQWLKGQKLNGLLLVFQ